MQNWKNMYLTNHLSNFWGSSCQQMDYGWALNRYLQFKIGLNPGALETSRVSLGLPISIGGFILHFLKVTDPITALFHKSAVSLAPRVPPGLWMPEDSFHVHLDLDQSLALRLTPLTQLSGPYYPKEWSPGTRSIHVHIFHENSAQRNSIMN